MFLKTIIIFSLVATAFAGKARIGLSVPLLSQRIVGGSDADRGEFPHQVSLQWGVPPFVEFSHLCGGSIIGQRWILTAGHCVNAIPAYGSFIVKAGKQLIKSTEPSEQVSYVGKTFVHDKYQGNVGPYDIALLRLRKPLILGVNVSAIRLPETESLPRGKAVLSGWGSVSTTNMAIMPDKLQKVSLPLIDLDTCRRSFKKVSNNEAPLDDTNVCTGSAPGGLSACSGDSGGPLIKKNSSGGTEIVGIVSWGITPCGYNNAPSVYVRVSAFINWIESTIEANGQ